jgi:hypothetical protein
MRQTEATAFPGTEIYLTKAMERLAELYELTGKKSEADKLRKEIHQRKVATKSQIK